MMLAFEFVAGVIAGLLTIIGIWEILVGNKDTSADGTRLLIASTLWWGLAMMPK